MAAAVVAEERFEVRGETYCANLRVALSDVRKLFNEDGTLIPIHQWPDDVAAAVASIETTEIGDGEKSVGRVHKIKLWPKVTALEELGKHLGLFAKDNEQKAMCSPRSSR